MDFDKKVYAFIKELKGFQYEFSFGDCIWKIIFLDNKNRWHQLYVQEYNEIFYISLIDGEATILEVQVGKKVEASESHLSFGGRASFDYNDISKQWELLISSARIWLERVQQDWIKMN